MCIHAYMQYMYDTKYNVYTVYIYIHLQMSQLVHPMDQLVAK